MPDPQRALEDSELPVLFYDFVRLTDSLQSARLVLHEREVLEERRLFIGRLKPEGRQRDHDRRCVTTLKT